MEIHPAFILMLSILGAYFAGILGFIIVLPLTMVTIKMFKYFRDSIMTVPLAIMNRL
jgi:predicted PurR-regulated permease PerM